MWWRKVQHFLQGTKQGVQGSSVQSLSCVRRFATPWTAESQASLSITNSWSLLRLMSIELVMPSNHPILCRPLVICNLAASKLFLLCSHLYPKELTHLKRPWCLERLKAGGEGDNRGLHGWMASPAQWTWVLVDFGSWWWTGRHSVLQSMGSQRVGHDWATSLAHICPSDSSLTEPCTERQATGVVV